jgi:hypothetical protein
LFHCCPKLSMNFSDPTMEYKKKISQIGPVELSKLHVYRPLVSDAKILIGFMASPARPHFPLKSNDFHAENPRPQPIQRRSFCKLRASTCLAGRFFFSLHNGASRWFYFEVSRMSLFWTRKLGLVELQLRLPHRGRRYAPARACVNNGNCIFTIQVVISSCTANLGSIGPRGPNAAISSM